MFELHRGEQNDSGISITRGNEHCSVRVGARGFSNKNSLISLWNCIRNSERNAFLLRARVDGDTFFAFVRIKIIANFIWNLSSESAKHFYFPTIEINYKSNKYFDRNLEHTSNAHPTLLFRKRK